MAVIIPSILVLIIVIIVGLALRKPDTFHYEREMLINAPADKIFPYLSDMRKGQQWSPWIEMDPDMKQLVSDPSDHVGSTYEWAGDASVGAGKITVVEIVPNRSVKMKLDFFKPIRAENMAEYSITPSGEGSVVRWSMYGDNKFIGKVMSVFMDCEKMMAEQFDKGLAKLKSIIE